MNQKVFLTDGEFESLVGEHVTKAIRALTSHEHVQQVCAACRGKCCQDTGCGFYSPKFDSCPIFERRPAKCRLFFCPQVLEDESLDRETRGLLDMQVQKLSDIVEPGCAGMVFGDAPAIQGCERSLTGLRVEAKAKDVVQELESRQLDSRTAQEQLRDLVAGYRVQVTRDRGL